MWSSTATRASWVGWSPRSSRTAFSMASSQDKNQWSLLPLWVRGVERVQLCATRGPVRLAVWRRAPAGLLVGRVAASGFRNLPRLRKLGQASGDASSIEVQALGHLASCAPGMLAQELDDARLGVNLAGARGCTTSARSPSGGAAPRASWRCRRCPVVVRVELLDLLFEPGETLLEFRALGFERVDYLLNAGQVLLLLRTHLLGAGARDLLCTWYVNARSRGRGACTRSAQVRDVLLGMVSRVITPQPTAPVRTLPLLLVAVAVASKRSEAGAG